MIYTLLAGGLGNQMFQYAAARAVSLRLGSTVALDISFFPGPDNRHYELGVFRIEAKVLGPVEQKLIWFKSRRKVRRLRQLFTPFLPGHPLQVIENHGHDWDDRITHLSGNVYLHGLWQAPAYFASIDDTLRRDFTFIDPPDETNQRLLDEIESVTSVALHVRRGDYLVGPDNLSQYATCSMDYYQAGMRQLREKFSNLHFFVFSDDPAWARENLKIEGPATFVTHNSGRRNHEDLRLMSHCRHFIIANSTFSWWGAWLGRDSQKHVIAPKKWFLEKSLPNLFPTNWEILDL